MLSVLKQGTDRNGFIWVYGTLDLGVLVITDIFNTSLKDELDVNVKQHKIKKLKIRRNKDNKIIYSIEF